LKFSAFTKILGLAEGIDIDSLIFFCNMLSNKTKMTSRIAPEDVDFVLQIKLLAYFLGLCRFALIVPLDNFNHFLLAVDHNSSALIDVVGNK